MNQQSSIGFGTDATVLEGYINAANERLGNIDLIIENTGRNDLYLVIKEQNTPSGYAAIGAPISVVPRGVQTRSLNLLTKRIGFFGSGNTTANISTVIRNKGDLRGAQIDIVATGRRNYGYDVAFDKNAFRPTAWGSPPDRPDIPPV